MNFRNLDVYQRAIRFLPLASEIASALPPKQAALADQIRRASLSISLNIAEGSGKTTATRSAPVLRDGPEAPRWSAEPS